MKSLTKQLVLGIAALSGFTFSAVVLADAKATLSGYDEVPSISTTATGKFTAKIENNQINFTLEYNDLSSPPLFAHVHFGQQHTNGGVMFFLCGPPRPACPISGQISGVVTVADIIGPVDRGILPGELDEAINAINSGAAYVNVHTVIFPGGEIRGQIK